MQIYEKSFTLAFVVDIPNYITQLEQENALLKSENLHLKQKVSDLEEKLSILLSSTLVKDSHNSSLPPSSDSVATKVVGIDETGCRVNGKNQWIWVWQDAQNTLLKYSENRGSQTIQETWEAGLPQSVLVTDRWSAQLKTASVDKQLEQKLNQMLLYHIDKEKYPQSHTFQKSMFKYKNYLLTTLYRLEVPLTIVLPKELLEIPKSNKRFLACSNRGRKAFAISVLSLIQQSKEVQIFYKHSEIFTNILAE